MATAILKTRQSISTGKNAARYPEMMPTIGLNMKACFIHSVAPIDSMSVRP